MNVCQIGTKARQLVKKLKYFNSKFFVIIEFNELQLVKIFK